MGLGNKLFVTEDPLIINDVYHPAINVISNFGEVLSRTEVTNETGAVTYPVQSGDGIVYFGSTHGRVFSFNPRTEQVQTIYENAGYSFDSNPEWIPTGVSTSGQRLASSASMRMGPSYGIMMCRRAAR